MTIEMIETAEPGTRIATRTITRTKGRACARVLVLTVAAAAFIGAVDPRASAAASPTSSGATVVRVEVASAIWVTGPAADSAPVGLRAAVGLLGTDLTRIGSSLIVVGTNSGGGYAVMVQAQPGSSNLAAVECVATAL